MRAHRADGCSHRLRRLVIGLALDTDQQDRGALIARETPQRCIEVSQNQTQLACTCRRSRLGYGNLLQCCGRTIGSRHPGKKAVTHDRIEPAAQIGARLPQMRVGESLHDRILDEVLGIGLLAVPMTSGAPQERDFVFNAVREVRISRSGPWSGLKLAYEAV